ncbi:MAG: hypothetical protein ACKOUM_05050, partial [Sphingopyxis sp.]
MIGRFKTALAPARAADFTVRIADQDVEVRVMRHAAARRLRLRYDAARGELRLVMPMRGGMAAARAWVAEQSGWIARQLADRPVAQLVGDGCRLPWGDGGLHVRWAAQHPRTPQLYRAQYGADGADGGDGTGPGGEWELRLGGPAAYIGPRVRRWLVAHALDIFSAASHTMAQRMLL